MSDLCPAIDIELPPLLDDQIGATIWLKSSAHRYHGGPATIVSRLGHRYVVRRIGAYPGKGVRQFKVSRGEFVTGKEREAGPEDAATGGEHG